MSPVPWVLPVEHVFVGSRAINELVLDGPSSKAATADVETPIV